MILYWSCDSDSVEVTAAAPSATLIEMTTLHITAITKTNQWKSTETSHFHPTFMDLSAMVFFCMFPC